MLRQPIRDPNYSKKSDHDVTRKTFLAATGVVKDTSMMLHRQHHDTARINPELSTQDILAAGLYRKDLQQ